jgi:hypothetical protein
VVKHQPNHAANRDRNQNNDEDPPGLQSTMGRFQPKKTDDDEQNRSEEEQENTHMVRSSEMLK